MTTTQHACRKYFPALEQQPEVIYLDSASTTQKPSSVLAGMMEYYQRYCANVGRGNYTWAQKVTDGISSVREKVATFLHAHHVSEIVFTSGTTAGINTIAYAWGLHNLRSGDEILYCPDDHKANVLPWLHLQALLQRFGTIIHLIPYSIMPSGEIDYEGLRANVSSKTRLITLTHIHNVFGALNDIARIRTLVGKEIVLSLDAAQSVGHLAVDVQELGVDFLSFSGHKMFAAPGTGVLWIHTRIHDQLAPFLVGGEQEIASPSGAGEAHLPVHEMPHLLEAGTLNIPGLLSLGKAIDFINDVTLTTIEQHGKTLTSYLLRHLQQLPEVIFLPGIAYSQRPLGYGILSFYFEGYTASELGFILSSHNIYVRVGTHCTRGRAAQQDSVRISLHVYNTTEEIDTCMAILQQLTNAR